MTRSYAVVGLERGVGHGADDNAVAHFRGREPFTALGEVDPLDVNTELPQQVHQGAGPAAEVERVLRLNTSLMSAGFFSSIWRRVSML